jgi:acyl carrier protein phosphodiesterase
MNYLAHIYLSGENDQIKVGNLIGDWVKGANHKKLSENVQKGVLMHRFIDWFTDNHPIVKQSKARVAEHYGKYSGIIIDILYDHFLACHWDEYSNIELFDFIESINKSIDDNLLLIPEGPREFFPSFMKNRWMEIYVSMDGIEKVFHGMSKHTSLPDKTHTVIQVIRDNYEEFSAEFNSFFPLLINEIEARFDVRVRK